MGLARARATKQFYYLRVCELFTGGPRRKSRRTQMSRVRANVYAILRVWSFYDIHSPQCDYSTRTSLAPGKRVLVCGAFLIHSGLFVADFVQSWLIQRADLCVYVHIFFLSNFAASIKRYYNNNVSSNPFWVL